MDEKEELEKILKEIGSDLSAEEAEAFGFGLKEIQESVNRMEKDRSIKGKEDYDDSH